MAFVLIALLVLLCIAPLFWRAGRTDVLSPDILVGLLVFGFVVVRVVWIVSVEYQDVLGFEATPLAVRRESLQSALVVVLLGLASFHAAYFMSSRWPQPRLPHFGVQWQGTSATLIGLAYVGVGIASTLYLFTAIGSPRFILSHQYLISEIVGDHGAIYSGVQFLALGFLVLLVPQRHGRLPAICAGAIALVVFTIIGRRWSLLVLILPVVVMFHFRVRAVRRLHLVVGFVALAIVFNAAYMLRFAGSRISDIGQLAEYGSALWKKGYLAAIMARGGEFKLFDMIMLGTRDYPTWRDYEFGRSILDAPLSVIPRSIYPDKAISYDVILAARLVPGRTAGLPAMSFGRLYMDLGLVGVVVGMALLGVLSSLAHGYSQRYREEPATPILYSIFLLFLLDYIRVADYSRTFFVFLRLLIPVAIACYLSTRSPSGRWRRQYALVKSS